MPELKVFLDHHIARENLRYKRPEIVITRRDRTYRTLRISDLVAGHMSSKNAALRKPDFQRATYAWTPLACMSLLETLVSDQVIPSIIMWSSRDSGHDFILDGGHRVSVVMAWLLDDWGDKLPPESYADEIQRREIEVAANSVRTLVNTNIGSFTSYVAAEAEFQRINDEGKSIAKEVMNQDAWDRAAFYRLLRGDYGFDILWVNGDYARAEESFLKINTSGTALDDWETELIRNRNSSFARSVMSIANVDSVDHYWPAANETEFVEPLSPEDTQELNEKISEIRAGVQTINQRLFKPLRQRALVSLTQPIMEVPEQYKRPYWIGELLTIIAGYRGMKADTHALMENERESHPPEIIRSGHALVTSTNISLDHIIGQTPRSLSLVSSLYFYTLSGRYVRSLFYGFLYWMLDGSDEEILRRKRLFSAYRHVFEKILFDRKRDSTSGITRRTGSGPEVTQQTADYYDGLLRLLVEHKGNIYTALFREDYSKLVKDVTGRAPTVSQLFPSNRRIFTTTQKNTKVLTTLLGFAPSCGICGGLIDLQNPVQHDHIQPHSEGGATEASNQRIVHPFCNNSANRTAIEAIKAGQTALNLPFFGASGDRTLLQLNFFELDAYNDDVIEPESEP